MTQNVVSYLKQREDVRSNTAREAETHRSNLVQEQLLRMQHEESARHNVASEALSRSQLYETQRSNRAREAEAYRSNLASERLKAESTQASLASTRMQTAASRYAAETSAAASRYGAEQSASASRYATTTQATTAANALYETSKHNVATEGIERARVLTTAADILARAGTNVLRVVAGGQ